MKSVTQGSTGHLATEFEINRLQKRVADLNAANLSLTNRLDLAMTQLDELGCDNEYYFKKIKALIDDVV